MKKRKMTKFLALPLVVAVAATAVPGAALTGYAQNSTGSFYPTHATKEEALQAARDLNVQIAEEGVVLLKNNENALPVSTRSNVSVFGYSSESIQGVSGNASMATALADKGFRVNPVLKNFYAGLKYNANTQGRGEISEFTPAVERSIDAYGDVAFVTVTRFLAEGTFAGDHNTVLNGKAAGVEKNTALDKQVIDEEKENIGGWEHEALYSETVNGKEETYKHELMLANQEVALLNYVKQLKREGRVKKIIYLMNAVVPLEMYNLENDEDVDGILMISRPGTTGLEGVANVIAGDANPSGKTNQIYVKDYTADPVWYNVGLNNQVNADQSKITYDKDGKVEVGDKLNANSILSKISYNYIDKDGNRQTTRGAIYQTPTGTGRNGASATYNKYANGVFGIDYEEDIYRDYWYYETKAADMNAEEAGTGTAWYNDAVVYPFGYGLSYGAKFKYEITDVKLNDNSALEDLTAAKLASSSAKAADVTAGTISVKVTNVGNVEGKEAVQLYSTAPYTGKAEKPHVKLLGFEKTNNLKPGASQTVKIDFDFQDIASYDWRGLTGDKGYVLEQGEYELHAMGNSNGWMDVDKEVTDDDYDVVDFTLDADAYLKLDDFSGEAISNKFSPENGVFSSVRGVEGNLYQFNASATAHQTFLSRADKFTTSFPEAPTADDMTVSMETLNRLSYWDKFQIGSGIVNFDEQAYWQVLSGTGYSDGTFKNPTPDDFTGVRYQDGQDVWSKDGKIVAAGTAGATKIVDGEKDFPWIADFNANKSKMDSWNQAKAGTSDATKVQLKEMGAYAPFSTEKINKDSEKTQEAAWTEFMNQLTYAEMEQISLRGQGSRIDRIGMASLSGGGDSNSVGGYKWASNGMLASTYNKDLAKKQGQIIGDLFMTNTNNNAWWGGASQCIRTVWAGRNGEFHSTDPILTGFMASTLTKEVAGKGVAVCIKHGILNDQQFPDVSPMTTWISEQAIREIYAKPFQMSIQQGRANYFMGSYARIGTMYNGVNYNFITGLIRGEWGAKDIMYTTDNHAQVGKVTAGDMMARAGVSDMNTGNSKGLSGDWVDGEGTANGKVVYSMADKLTAPTAGSTLLSAEEEGQLQYFLARRNATIFINGHSKTLMNKNGLGFSAWKDAEDTAIELTQGVAASGKTVAGTIEGAESVTYSITNGSLPEGLTLNADGTITGTPVAAGSANITVTATADGWIKDTKQYTVTVATGFTVSAQSATAGTEFSAAVVFNGATSYTANGLPAGLSMASNGDISGTPTTPGTYTVTVTATTRNGTYTDTFDVTVDGTAIADGAVESVEIVEGKVIVTYENGFVAEFDRIAGADGANGDNGADGSKILLGTTAPEATAGKDGDVYLDTATYTLYGKADGAWTSLGSIKGADGAQGPAGATGPEGPQGPAGAPAEEGGCGSSLQSTAIMAASLGVIALAAIAIRLVRRKKD